ncbi:FAD-dependent oxidoreductase [Streptomyces sp. M10(2022)]
MEETFGCWYAAGGIRALAEAVYERCLARRVTFVFGADVIRVAERDGRAAGVELADGSVAEADHVVLGAQQRPGWCRTASRYATVPRTGARSRPFPGSAVAARCPGGRRSAPDRGARPDGAVEQDAVFGGRTADRPTVTVLRPDDPATRPDMAHEAVTLMATVAPHGGPLDWTDAALRERYADTLIDTAAAAVPGLRDRMLHAEVRTPAETAAETGAEGGSVPAPLWPGQRAPICTREQHQAAGPVPGGRLVASGRRTRARGDVGALVAGLLVEGDGFRGSQ